jgi:hypothetical protein
LHYEIGTEESSGTDILAQGTNTLTNTDAIDVVMFVSDFVPYKESLIEDGETKFIPKLIVP